MLLVFTLKRARTSHPQRIGCEGRQVREPVLVRNHLKPKAQQGFESDDNPHQQSQHQRNANVKRGRDFRPRSNIRISEVCRNYRPAINRHRKFRRKFQEGTVCVQDLGHPIKAQGQRVPRPSSISSSSSGPPAHPSTKRPEQRQAHQVHPKPDQQGANR